MPTDSAGPQEHDAIVTLKKRFRQTLERFRIGLAIADGLCDRDRRVALFMLEYCNRDIFLKTGALACWVGVETITLALIGKKALRADGKVDRSYVQRAQRKLRKAGVITVHEAGGGRGLSTTYLFSPVWLARITVDALTWAPTSVCDRLGAAATGSPDRTHMDHDDGGELVRARKQGFRAAVSDISGKTAPAVAKRSTGAAVLPAAVSGILGIAAAEPHACSSSSASSRGSNAAVSVASAAVSAPRDEMIRKAPAGKSAVSSSADVAEAAADAACFAASAGLTPASGSGATPSAGVSRLPRLRFHRRRASASAPQRYSVKRIGLTALPVDKGQDVSPRYPEKRSTDAVRSAASVQPESLDIKPGTWRPPFQQSLLLTLDGGKQGAAQSVASSRPSVQVPKLVGQGSAIAPVSARSLTDVVREEKERARKVAEAESDPRFVHLRTKALQLLGDSRLASLTIAVMDEQTKKRILRGYWPDDRRLREVLEAAAGTARSMLGLGVDATGPMAPPPPERPVRDRTAGGRMGDLPNAGTAAALDPTVASSVTQEDRLERMARDAADQAAAAVHGVQALQKDLQQITSLLQRLLMPDAGQQTAVA